MGFAYKLANYYRPAGDIKQMWAASYGTTETGKVTNGTEPLENTGISSSINP